MNIKKLSPRLKGFKMHDLPHGLSLKALGVDTTSQLGRTPLSSHHLVTAHSPKHARMMDKISTLQQVSI